MLHVSFVSVCVVGGGGMEGGGGGGRTIKPCLLVLLSSIFTHLFAKSLNF